MSIICETLSIIASLWVCAVLVTLSFLFTLMAWKLEVPPSTFTVVIHRESICHYWPPALLTECNGSKNCTCSTWMTTGTRELGISMVYVCGGWLTSQDGQKQMLSKMWSICYLGRSKCDYIKWVSTLTYVLLLLKTLFEIVIDVSTLYIHILYPIFQEWKSK